MRKIKLVISDLHISKGMAHEDGSPNLLEDFFYDRELMEFLAFFRSGDHKKCKVELIVNGDFLNTLQVDLREKFPEVVTEQIAVEKVKAILCGHPKLFEAFREFAHVPHHHITVIPGNHDPAFLWPAVRDFFGAFIETDVRFPMLQYCFDGFHVEHGNQYTAVNAYESGDFFIQEERNEPILKLPWGSHFIIGYLNRVKARRNFADKVRPLRRYLMWTLLNDPFFGWPAVVQLLFYFIRTRLVPGKLSVSELRHTWKILIEGFRFMPDLEKAAKRILFADPNVHTVIMGHTHMYMHRRFRADKEYLNTGTWNDTIYLDIERLGRQRKLTFALLEYPDNGRPRASLMEWKGIARPFETVEF